MGRLVTIANDGIVGDFRVEETSEGSGKFQLLGDELRGALIERYASNVVLMSHTKLTAPTLPSILLVT